MALSRPSRSSSTSAERGARDDFDAVGHHPYNYPSDRALRPSTSTRTRSLASPRSCGLLVRHGDRDKQIWGTETGAPTVGPGAARSLAEHVVVSYVAWNAWEYTGPLFWYSFRDAGEGEDPEDHFGLVSTRLRPKGSALVAFAWMNGGV